ncbi:DUF3899 domain-containing protein [Sutcliffiella halmapala]|uniref:DUF3899 domain-containing protein n=1 Tax=Sutcliffiella halmapala TaxID=79882 RepID=UPI000995226E|nr:DUF3899 domain-containing protein [Sutcliffiella halmapala]
MKLIFLWILTLPVSYFAISLFYQSSYLLNWANFLFLLGLGLVLTGGMLFVISGGFFSSFIYSCKVFFTSISRKAQIIKEIEGDVVREKNSFRKDYLSSKILVNIGLCYCLVSLFFSVLLIIL